MTDHPNKNLIEQALTEDLGNGDVTSEAIIPAGATALKAAGTIHSDLERGFIRAEVIPYDDLARVQTMAKAREHGLLRTEGRDYKVRDGDIVNIRFSV